MRSISDWKNEYHPQCRDCAVVDACAGFFASAKHRVSPHIRAVPAADAGRERSLLDLER